MKEIEQLEAAVIILAQAIENGRVDGLVQEVREIMGYIISKNNHDKKTEFLEELETVDNH